MGVIISRKEQIDAYFASDDASQSSLKKLIDGLDIFLANRIETSKLFFEEKGHFIIGSGTDCILTGEEDQFNKEYYVSEIDKKPSDTIMSIVSQVFSLVLDQVDESLGETLQGYLEDNGNDIEVYESAVLVAINDHNYQANWKEETRIKKVCDEGGIYFKDLQASHGKQIISQEQYNKIYDIAMSLKTNPITGKYFDRQMQARIIDMDFYYQLPIFFTYKGIKCKALLDLVAVFKDEDGKVIKIHPIDLKTMSGPTINFTSSVKSRRYDIQGAWYTLALQHHFGQDIEILPFTFIVESTTHTGNPLIYHCNPSLLEIGKNGLSEVLLTTPEGIVHVLKRETKGYEQLLDEYIWYGQNGWEKERIIQEKAGVLEIDWNGIMK